MSTGRRAPRRAVRPAGTVGNDDAVLLSTHAAAVPPPGAPPAAPPAPSAPPTSDPLLGLRSADDTDTGWGERGTDDNDARLHRDRPPHW
ncbi:hypothetical protein [Cellulomonas gilvus]|uniref:DNA helicase n=1 Tax=Cellulomonas gilvus (strain ATCC 13127 / NRRL B-14078) TaxID=593907 RepID=F8A6M0_CELGA|nr:hypothetical protein [Cellulomonas gilvus]AEI11080.1 DNA helicase [Cellulomonas gilvus ATCC 13127]